MFRFILLFLLTFNVFAKEEILDFHADIKVEPDSSIVVTETIRVRAQQRDIKRGIYRALPTLYNIQGRKAFINFKVEQVLRDGQNENYHIKNRSDYMYIYIGNKSVYLPAGTYEYTIRYRTFGLLGENPNNAELYWNVTGTEWKFPINKASATIYLPNGAAAEVIDKLAWTGKRGEKGKAYRYDNSEDRINVYTTTPLRKREGITISITFPKDYINFPSLINVIITNFLKEPRNKSLIFGTILLLFLFYIKWGYVGRDPKGKKIYPQFNAPEGMSAPLAHHIINKQIITKKIGGNGLSVAIISLAAKGFLTIKEDKEEILFIKNTTYELM